MQRYTQEIVDKALETLIKAQSEYNNAIIGYMKQILCDKCLDNNVIRVSDGKRGVIRIERLYLYTNYNYFFYPYTAKGVISQRSSGNVPKDLSGFVPADNKQ